MKEEPASFGDDPDCEDVRTVEAFEREIEVQKVAAENELAPQVKDAEVFQFDGDFQTSIACLKEVKLTEWQNYGVILMDRAEGLPLNEFVVDHKGCALPPKECPPAFFHIMNKVASTIDSLHKVGIWHGDMTFENVFVKANGENGEKITFIDFGKSVLVEGGAYETKFEEGCTEFVVGFPRIEQMNGEEMIKLFQKWNPICKEWTQGHQVSL